MCRSPSRNAAWTWWHAWCIYLHGVGEQRQSTWKVDNRCGLQQTYALIGELVRAERVVCDEAAQVDLDKELN